MEQSERKELLSIASSRLLDKAAHTEWGFHEYALIERAGRALADTFAASLAELSPRRGAHTLITAVTGSGNNGADTLAMIRSLLLQGQIEKSSVAVIVSRQPSCGEVSPWTELVTSLQRMGVSFSSWDLSSIANAANAAAKNILAQSDIIIDGIAGTGLRPPLEGAPLEMVNAVNALVTRENFRKRPLVISVDLPSGITDEWEPGMAAIEADITLAIELKKYCIYTPASRPYAGKIMSVDGIFPPGLINAYANTGAELLDWGRASKRVAAIKPNVYKHERGTVEVWAGSQGMAGAALIAARGAQAAGAGLVRLVVDDSIYPALVSRSSGIMITAASAHTAGDGKVDALLLGPGWGKSPLRREVFQKALALEKAGKPLILDADAFDLINDTVFNGNVILTPHPGEFSRLTGAGEKELSLPRPHLLDYCHKCKAVVLLKGHVLTITTPDGRSAVVDGMTATLAAGGSGDLLAGFAAGIAARMVCNKNSSSGERENFDPYIAASAAAALLVACGASKECRQRFNDPLELAGIAATLAGNAWLI